MHIDIAARFLPIAPALLAVATAAAAHDGDDVLARWYRSLRTWEGRSCCTMRDCHPAEARLTNGHWEVLVQPYEAPARWSIVPDHAVLRRDNPDGRPIVCHTPNGFIRCFVPPAGS